MAKKLSQQIQELVVEVADCFMTLKPQAKKSYFDWYHAKFYGKKELALPEECRIYAQIVVVLKNTYKEIISNLESLEEIILTKKELKEYLVDNRQLLKECKNTYYAVVRLQKQREDSIDKKDLPAKEKLAALLFDYKNTYPERLTSKSELYNKKFKDKYDHLITAIELMEELDGEIEITKPGQPISQPKKEFSFGNGQVFFNNKELELPCGEVQEQFCKLVDKLGKVVTYNELESGYSSARQGRLAQNISIIRKTLKSSRVPFHIKTYTGQGYCLKNYISKS